MGQLDASIIPMNYINLDEIKSFENLLILSSPLKRCRQTLDICIRQLIQMDCIKNIEIRFDENLRERHLGDFQGKNKIEARKIFPNFFNGNTLIPTITPPQGEDFITFFNRIQNFYSYLYNLSEFNGAIIVVSHLQVFKMLTCIHLNLNIDEIWASLKFEHNKLIKALE